MGNAATAWKYTAITMEENMEQCTFLYGRLCACTALSRRYVHRAHSSAPEFHPHLRSHSYSLQPRSTTVPLDTVTQIEADAMSNAFQN